MQGMINDLVLKCITATMFTFLFLTFSDHAKPQSTNARKVNCGRVYSAYILKPVLSGRNL